MFKPTLFAVTELRMRNLASNTIGNALRAIQLLMAYLNSTGIDLAERLVGGQLLDLHEIEALVSACRRPLQAFEEGGATQSGSVALPAPTAALERVRNRLRRIEEPVVSPAVMATRLQCIRDYVQWFAELHLSHVPRTLGLRGEIRAAVDAFVGAIDARIPEGSSPSEREGIAPEIRDRLLSVTRADSFENPWEEEHSRHRNALIVDWLLHLGLRRGELLNVKVADIDFHRATVRVIRRPDAPDDPRRNQPAVKTRGRDLPVSTGLIDATRSYVMNYRAGLPAARKHGYLFVASGSGAPLSMAGLAKVFAVLRTKVAGLPQELSPHVLRHTWNDRFSEEMDRQKVPEETERKARSYLMGWSETSGTAATYTKRHTREKARRISLELQEQMLTHKGPA